MFLPTTMLENVLWSFTGEPFDTRDEFASALRDYLADITGDTSFDADALVLLHPVVVLVCDAIDHDGDDVELEASLTAEDGHAFSVAELLFHAHNGFVSDLEDQDHHFFEGLTFEGMRNGAPVYRLQLGS